MLFLHLKDVVDIPADTPKAKYPFKFVELGRGRVDFPAAFAALKKKIEEAKAIKDEIQGSEGYKKRMESYGKFARLMPS